MKKNIETTKTGWPIPVKVKEEFTDFCERVSSFAQSDCAGALFLWCRMPSNIREWAKLEATDKPVVDENFWAGLQDVLQSIAQDLYEKDKDSRKNKS